MGRDRYSDRRIVEETSCITIPRIAKTGVFKDSNLGKTIRVENIQRTHLFSICRYKNSTESNYLIFKYTHQGKEIEMSIDLYFQPCNYGNGRYYFIGPISGKRVTALYIDDNGFLKSREQLGLVYLLSRAHGGRLEGLDISRTYRIKARKLMALGHPRLAKTMIECAERYEETGLKTAIQKAIKGLERLYRESGVKVD